MSAKGLPLLGAAAAAALGIAYTLVFFVAPDDADQGFVQKIFYLHVPLGIVALGGFVAGGVMGLQFLRTGDRRWDLRSYVSIHLSLILAVGVLATGSIWARASWGHWWVWSEPMLVSFLVVFLLYCCYQPLRFSIEDPDRQARAAAVFAVLAGAFVPLNFVAVRLAAPVTHPRVLSATGGSMPGAMRLAFAACMVAMVLLYLALWRLELARKSTAIEIRRLRRALERDDVAPPAIRRPCPPPHCGRPPRPMPALPLDEAGAYVAGAYVVFVVLLVLYVSIMARHVAKVREDLGRLSDEVRGDRG